MNIYTANVVTSTQLTSFLPWMDIVDPGSRRFLLMSWGTLEGRCGQDIEGPGVQPSLSAVLPVLLGGLELLRSDESCTNQWEKFKLPELINPANNKISDYQSTMCIKEFMMMMMYRFRCVCVQVASLNYKN